MYEAKFLRTNPGSAPLLQNNFRVQFQQRLQCPQVGDHVEVAWRGKFRLDSQDVYQGLAWWVAQVVGVQGDDKYKIRYPGKN
jgi:hypothetical protein